MNDGGNIFVSYDIRATAIEVLRDPNEPEAPVTLYCLGLNTALHIPRDDAERIAYEIIAAVTSNQDRDPASEPKEDV